MKLASRLFAALYAALVVLSPVRAEDTDLFQINPNNNTQRPNVLIVVDNTANWNTPFDGEKSTLQTVFNSLDDKFNVGLMLFTETGNPNDNLDGGYVRFGVRQMTSANKDGLSSIVSSLDKLNDKSNGGKAGKMMYEAYLYFKGATGYSGIGKVKRDYSGNTTYNTNAASLPGNALTSSGSTQYNSPVVNGCQKNFIIYISNGPAQDNTSDINFATTKLSEAGGDTTTISVSPTGSQSNVADEWARFLRSTGFNVTANGNTFNSKVDTYTVDVLPGTNDQGPGWTALLKSMANNGKNYYAATDAASLAIALNDIFQQIAAVNSVFAAVTLPISTNVRGTNLNQVYMGVFRPHESAAPRWAGNLKLYQLDTSLDLPSLTDRNNVAIENPTTGFIKPNVTSFWTTTTSPGYWSASYSSSFYDYANSQGTSGTQDAADGDIVEKGGAAFRLRQSFATSLTNRNVYTCTGTCPAASVSTATATAGTSLSSTPFSTGNSVVTASLGSSVIDWICGANVKNEDNPDNNTAHVRGFLHGDVVHSRPAVVNYNRSSQPAERDIYVFYGANDGLLHAVKGGKDDADGGEAWSFVVPEHFSTLQRLYDASPVISGSNPKPYFIDGPVTVYQKDANNDHQYVAANGDLTYLYLAMRRGGRFTYALNVSDPLAPKFLWKKGNTSDGYKELGQTWSEQRVSRIRASTDPVLIFGAGYDPAVEDIDPTCVASSTATAVVATSSGGCPGGTHSRTMGRGIMVVNAVTGAPIWQAGPGPADTTLPSGAIYKVVSGMNYTIAADLSVINRDLDVAGYADRIYAVDTGGNVWRVNIDDADPNNWSVTKIASLGGTGTSPRKFLNAPDVVYGRGYDAVLVGTGDREHPFDTTVGNRYYMIKDNPGLNATMAAPVGDADLCDASLSTVSVCLADATKKGWFRPLTTGEKVVTTSLTLAGVTYFATNVPQSVIQASQPNACSPQLGEARLYALSFDKGQAVFNFDGVAGKDVYQVHPGGGFLPNPTGYNVGGKIGVIFGTATPVTNPLVLGQRTRVFWNKRPLTD